MMPKKVSKIAKQAISITILLACSSPSAFALFGSKDANLDQRVQRLEQITDARTDYDLQNRIQQLQEIVSQLQGQIEVQSNQIKTLTEQQHAMYRDLDDRINKITGESPSSNDNVEDSDRAMPQVGEQAGDAAASPSVPLVGPGMRSDAIPSQAPPTEPLIEQTVPGHR